MIFLNKLGYLLSLSLIQQISQAEIASQVAAEDERYAYGQVILAAVNNDSEYYQSYFSSDGLYDSLASLYNLQKTALFWNRWIQTSIIDLEMTMFSQLPETKRSTLMEAITSLYSAATEIDATVTTWESPPVTTPSSSSWNTAVPLVTNTGPYSNVYNYAKCDAMYFDIHNFGSNYNSFFDTYTNTQDMSSFMTQYSIYVNHSDVHEFDDACSSMVAFLTDIPWNARILASARDLFQTYRTKYVTVLTSTNTNYSTTTFTDTSVTVSNQLESSAYDLAKWYAVLADYASNVDQYTSLMSSYLDQESSTAEIDNFAQAILLLNKTSGLGATAYSSIYQDIESVYSLFTWSDRLLYVAKGVYESYTSAYTLSSLLSSSLSPSLSSVQTTSALTSTIAPSASPGYSPSVITVTTTAYSEVTNTYPVSVVYIETLNKDNSSTEIEHSLTETTVTLVETVNGTFTYGAHPTIKVTSDIFQMMYCGVDALIYDFLDKSDAYNSYISASSDLSAVQGYLSAITRYSTTNIFNDMSIYTDALVTIFDFVFRLPSEFRPRLFDLLGYVYMDHITQDTSDFKFSNYRSGSGQLFNDLFAFGGLDSNGTPVALTTELTTTNGTVISVETEVAVSGAGEGALIFPTALKLDLTATVTQDPEFFYITTMKSDTTHTLLTKLQ